MVNVYQRRETWNIWFDSTRSFPVIINVEGDWNGPSMAPPHPPPYKGHPLPTLPHADPPHQGYPTLPPHVLSPPGYHLPPTLPQADPSHQLHAVAPQQGYLPPSNMFAPPLGYPVLPPPQGFGQGFGQGFSGMQYPLMPPYLPMAGFGQPYQGHGWPMYAPPPASTPITTPPRVGSSGGVGNIESAITKKKYLNKEIRLGGKSHSNAMRKITYALMSVWSFDVDIITGTGNGCSQPIHQ